MLLPCPPRLPSFTSSSTTARLPASGPNVCTTSAGGRPCPAAATSHPPSNPSCSAVTSQPSSTTSGRLASPGEGQDHTGHGVDRVGVGQAVSRGCCQR